MKLPDYSITPDILKNIATIEYSKALIELTTILPNWQTQLRLEAKTRTITYSLQRSGINADETDVKAYLDNLKTNVLTQIKTTKKGVEMSEELAVIKDFDEKEIKKLNEALGGGIKYRSEKIKGKTSPEEILAQMTELMDWYNSRDAQETHPIIKTAILKAQIELIQPFEETNDQLSDMLVRLCLNATGYGMRAYLSLEEHYYQTQKDYADTIEDIAHNNDFTQWIEYFSDILSREASNVGEKVKILAKDTKIARAAGRTLLSERQQRIVTYLQDYGLLQNKDFNKLFPDISEDTVLRELKKLVDEGIIVKRGKTKSSRYELP